MLCVATNVRARARKHDWARISLLLVGKKAVGEINQDISAGVVGNIIEIVLQRVNYQRDNDDECTLD